MFVLWSEFCILYYAGGKKIKAKQTEFVSVDTAKFYTDSLELPLRVL